MTSTASSHLYTVDEAKSLEDAEAYELIDGVLNERDLGTRASWYGAALIGALVAYARETGLFVVLEGHVALHLFPERPRHFRRADAAMILKARFEERDVPDGDLYLAPDLAAEVLSPNDTTYEADAKLNDYLNAGVRMVWFVYPESRTLMVYRPGEAPLRLSEDDVIPGFDVLPEFDRRVRDLFPV